jgi:hypothetical protein
MTFFYLSLELLSSVHRWVDASSKLRLDPPQQNAREVEKLDIANHHEVNITFGLLLGRGD